MSLALSIGLFLSFGVVLLEVLRDLVDWKSMGMVGVSYAREIGLPHINCTHFPSVKL